MATTVINWDRFAAYAIPTILVFCVLAGLFSWNPTAAWLTFLEVHYITVLVILIVVATFFMWAVPKGWKRRSAEALLFVFIALLVIIPIMNGMKFPTFATDGAASVTVASAPAPAAPLVPAPTTPAATTPAYTVDHPYSPKSGEIIETATGPWVPCFGVGFWEHLPSLGFKVGSTKDNLLPFTCTQSAGCTASYRFFKFEPTSGTDIPAFWSVPRGSTSCLKPNKA